MPPRLSPATRRAGSAGFSRLDGKVGTNLFWRELAVVAGHEFEFVAPGEVGRAGLTKTRSATDDGFARPTAETFVTTTETRKARYV